ncbi:MAG TPA: class I SAM-dependent methyltransferase [Fimbriimonadaceae bacterium]|nr:class I SAM-dependent methyltransferase [Fimbriimonadaceae bacterium]HRJ96704.1 class I SAM-dependent methyltransferase [Fimbriimonadaceae bacterium]
MSEGKTFWQAFFDSHAAHYDENPFTKNTMVEVDFLFEVMALRAGLAILDVGCGTGRHAVELARRGLRVTGVDLSEGMLERAKLRAEQAGVQVEWVHADAARYVHPTPFDAAICLCEGAFNLTEAQEDPVAHDLGILRSVAASLKPGAPFVLTAMNGYATIRQMKDEAVEAGQFDPATMRSAYQDEWNLPEGPVLMTIHERLFIPPEIVAMLHHAGFEVLNVWGGTAGDWGKRKIRLDEVEVMFVSRKRPDEHSVLRPGVS